MGIDYEVFEKNDIHIHVPAGATPKDGPSAGITIATTIVSLLCHKKIDHEVAMTGEITLRGNVMPVGGIKEKVIAAKRAGCKRIIIPSNNASDIINIPKHILKSIKIIPVTKIDEVWEHALV